MTIFSATQLKFDKEYLEELTKEPGSGVSKLQCKYHMALHPAQFNDFGQSIKDELGRKIGKYDDSFKGIMLGFRDVKLHSQLGAIGIDNCYIHIDIEATFFVFKPELQMMLKGIVTRKTKDHVGCLVYNTFNISLPKLEGDDEEWLGSKVTVGSEVEFKIIYVDLNARLPHIRGELRSILSKGNDPNNMDVKPEKIIFDNDIADDIPRESNVGKKSKKKRKSISEEMQIDVKEEVIEELATSPKKSKKKHKQKQISESAADTNEPDVTPKKSKKHKHKEKRDKQKNDEMDVSLESLDLASLFNTPVNFDEKYSQTADSSEKKPKRKRSQSVSKDLYLDEVKLEPDSDLEKIFS